MGGDGRVVAGTFGPVTPPNWRWHRTRHTRRSHVMFAYSGSKRGFGTKEEKRA